MAVPKKKTSKSVKKMRQGQKQIQKFIFITCPICNNRKTPHHMCLTCGCYTRSKKNEKEPNRN